LWRPQDERHGRHERLSEGIDRLRIALAAGI
jgi:hypothetical protein